jgi:hypothetical protein
MRLVSPDGKTTLLPHPSKIQYYLDRGWKEEEVKKTRAKPKKEEPEVTEIQDEEESE